MQLNPRHPWGFGPSIFEEAIDALVEKRCGKVIDQNNELQKQLNASRHTSVVGKAWISRVVPGSYFNGRWGYFKVEKVDGDDVKVFQLLANGEWNPSSMTISMYEAARHWSEVDSDHANREARRLKDQLKKDKKDKK